MDVRKSESRIQQAGVGVFLQSIDYTKKLSCLGLYIKTQRGTTRTC